MFAIFCGRIVFGIDNRCDVIFSVFFWLTKLVLELIWNFARNHFPRNGTLRERFVCAAVQVNLWNMR